MSPVVKTSKLAFNGFIVFVLAACIAWWAIVGGLSEAYGSIAGLTFAFASIATPVLIYGMKRHKHHDGYYPECDCNCCRERK